MAKKAEKVNNFDSKLKGWIDSYYHVVRSRPRSTYECILAMRDFVKNVYPLATERAKNSFMWDSVENAVRIMEFAPETYVHNIENLHRFLQSGLDEICE